MFPSSVECMVTSRVVVVLWFTRGSTGFESQEVPPLFFVFLFAAILIHLCFVVPVTIIGGHGILFLFYFLAVISMLGDVVCGL